MLTGSGAVHARDCESGIEVTMGAVQLQCLGSTWRSTKAWLAARVDAVSDSPCFTPIEAVFRNREDNRVATGWDLCANEEDSPVLLSIASRIQS